MSALPSVLLKRGKQVDNQSRNAVTDKSEKWNTVAHNILKAYDKSRFVTKNSYGLDMPLFAKVSQKPMPAGVRVPLLLDEYKEEHRATLNV